MSKYTSRKRAPRMSKRFFNKVQDAITKPQVIRQTFHGRDLIPTDGQVWNMVAIGFNDGALLSTVIQTAYNSAAGYKVADPNTSTVLSPLSLWFKVHIEKWNVETMITNTSLSRIQLTFYHIVPRVWVPTEIGSPAVWTNHDEGILLTSTGSQAQSTSVDFTPYQSGMFPHYWKIIGTTTHTIAPGGQHRFTVEMNNFTVTNGHDNLDSYNNTASTFYARPGKSKCVMWRAHGCEATDIATGATTYFAPAEYRVKNITNIQFRPVSSNRPIQSFIGANGPAFSTLNYQTNVLNDESDNIGPDTFLST